MSAWQPIATAPYNTPVRVKAGRREFAAILLPDAAMTTEEQSCDQWHACFEGVHPRCWTDGACWEVNADERASIQPTHWQPLPESPLSPRARHSAELECQ